MRGLGCLAYNIIEPQISKALRMGVAALGLPSAKIWMAAEAEAQKGSSVATKAQVEKAIFEREGFRVELELFGEKRQTLPPYEFSEMAPQRWKVSDWKNARLDAYRLLAKGVKIYLGDGTPINRDLQLGKLRDTYYEAAHGSLQPPSGAAEQIASVTQLRPHRKR
jgi:hypothetical protein